ncbi:Oligosaccharide translocation protein RFT1 [Lachancea thermotolerans]|uniref:Man(5)GlcNAc(2)-PP-dolichol translocation protein RFT1 n=1 Tax=Lachancea thermotolerans (strain ATCC 56472 / CBS 6340 / NRRL Y-8284) TaxID=559295 RepID=C5E2W4_LACTC|nr:KLTH0H08228p [Lachancea thermotolerans CBS 6340]CAR30375.1 KLTH0H08228p [Lachancea thermotolerans CBS 6340]
MEKRGQVSQHESMLKRSAKGVTFLMFSQLFSKIVTFILNTLLVRYLSPRVFGINAFLEFLLSTVLFFSREAIRMSTLRIKSPVAASSATEDDPETDDAGPGVLQTAINFAYIPLCIGVPLSLVLIGWQYSNLNEYFLSLPYFKLSIAMIWLSIIFELLNEPFFVVNQLMLNYKVRSQLESIAVVVSCIANFSIVYVYENKFNGSGIALHDATKQEGIAILAFAVSKLVHSTALLCCYYYDYLTRLAPAKKFNISPSKVQLSAGTQPYYLQSEVLQHFKKVYLQLCFKHLLTEGDKLIINSMCSVEEQGIYSLLSNYGSLLTRLLFAPIEESLRLFLARLLSVTSTKNTKLSMDVLVNLTKFYLYLSLLILVFGPTNSPFLLQFLIGSKWSSTSVLDTIQVYCLYLPFLSINGIFEAFFQSVASGEDILRQSYFMIASSGVFLLSCWLLISQYKMSLEGLIFSNIINMLLRIGFCGRFINAFYKRVYSDPASHDSTFLLNFSNLKAVSLVALVIALSNYFLFGVVKTFGQLSINAIMAFGLLSLILYKEKDIIRSYLKQSKRDEVKDA